MMVIHLCFYLFLFVFLIRYQPKINPLSESPFSIVVCAKNEEKSLPSLLQHLKSQSADEVIIVDDFSTDDTRRILERQNWVRNVRPEQLSLGKKGAQQKGVSTATNNRILCTDADCTPASSKWANIMNSIEKDFVLGYGPMSKKGGMIALFSRYETYMTAVQYLSYALAKIPYMGVGRNMLITKSAIDRSKIKGNHLASGDDDLTINALSTGENTGICIDPRAFVYSAPKQNIRSFIKQKSRHLTTAVHYKFIHQVLLTLWSGSQLGFYISIIIGLLIGTISMSWAFIALCIKWAVQLVVHFFLMKKLKESELLLWSPLLDIVMFIYYLIMPFIVFFTKKESKWS